MDLWREQRLSVTQVCQELGVGRSTVFDWIGRGLEAVKIGGRVFTSREAITRFSRPINSPETEAAHAIPAGSYRDDARRLRLRHGAKAKIH